MKIGKNQVKGLAGYALCGIMGAAAIFLSNMFGYNEGVESGRAVGRVEGAAEVLLDKYDISDKDSTDEEESE